MESIDQRVGMGDFIVELLFLEHSDPDKVHSFVRYGER